MSTITTICFKVKRLKSVYKLLVPFFLFLLMQEKYEQLKVDTNVQVSSSTDDHLFFKACGGWSEKGTLYGLGRRVLPCLRDQLSLGAVAVVLHQHTPPR